MLANRTEGGGMSIKRYTVIFEEEHIGECETGKFVLYTDHLAEIAACEKELEIRTKSWANAANIVEKQIEQIAVLTVDKAAETGDLLLEIDELQKRIKELEEDWIDPDKIHEWTKNHAF
jgi:hypothetical protein